MPYIIDGHNLIPHLGLSLSAMDDELTLAQRLSDEMEPLSLVHVTATKPNGQVINFNVKVMLNTTVEVNYFRNGGILHTVLRNLVK